MSKELYEVPAAEVILFAEQDIVTASGPDGDDVIQTPFIPFE